MAAATEDQDMDAQIQEKTITSLTEDLKTKVDSEEKQEDVLDKNKEDDKDENHQNGLEEGMVFRLSLFTFSFPLFLKNVLVL